MSLRAWPLHLLEKSRVRLFAQGAIFFLLLAIPFQKKFKIFKGLAHLCTQGFVFPEAFQKNIYFYVTDLSLIACLLFLLPLRSLFSHSTRYLTLLFMAAVLSLMLSPGAGCPLHVVRLLHFALVIALFCALDKGAIFESVEQLLPKLCALLVVLGALESAIGMAQYFLRSDVGLGFLGEAKTNCWVQSKSGLLSLFGGAKEGVLRRASGTFPHPNVFGGFLLVTIVANYALLTLRRSWLLLLCLALQIFTLCLTFSRAALAAWFVATALFFFLGYRQKLVSKTGCYAACLSMLLSLAILFPAIRDRGGIVNYNTIVKASDQERVQFQNIALEMVRKHPLFGVGFNQYVVRMQDFSSVKLQGDQFFPVHNIYLLVAAETGLVGLGFFLLFIGSILWRACLTPFSLAKSTLLALFMGFLLIGFCDFYLLGSQHGKLLFFLVAALLSLSCREEEYAHR